MNKIIISIGDYSGHWSKPYADAGYTVIQVDPKLTKRFELEGEPELENVKWLPWTAQELRDFVKTYGELPVTGNVDAEIFPLEVSEVHGMLLAPPCTDFSVSGAQYWPQKDANGTTAEALDIVDACIELVELCSPEWWVLENPVGRLPKLRPETLGKPQMYFQPHHYAGHADDPQKDRYTKKTGLWGSFNKDLLIIDMEPIKVCKQGSWIQKLGGKSEKTKELRSMTPQGFSRAFFKANQ